METHWSWLGAVVVLVGVTLLVHPFWKMEGFQTGTDTGSGSGSGSTTGGVSYKCTPGGGGDETIVYRYIADSGDQAGSGAGVGAVIPWSGETLNEWTQQVQSIEKQFQRIQTQLQNSLKTYESTEGSLEQNARKKREHWLTMTPQQRSQAKMIEDPVQEYYATLTGASRLPLGGLPDNEGKLPFGIPQIAFPSPSSIPGLLSPGVSSWGASAPDTRTPDQRRGEQEFYRKAREYVASISSPITDLDTNIKLFSWSVRDNDKISLLPRVEMLQRQLEEAKKNTRDKKGSRLNIPPKKEGFDTSQTSTGCKTVEIVVYSWEVASKKLKEYQAQLNTMETTTQTLADDVSKANAILQQIQKDADASRERARPR